MRILSEAGVKGMVPYRDAGEIPAFAVMELIDGPNLRAAVEGRFVGEWPEILRIGWDLTRIIRSAHQLPQRVLHRDIRPSNIMLEGFFSRPDDWRVVVLDFDLSWHKDAMELSVMNANAVSGYLAPEQISATAGASTRHSAVDSFGLGMTLFYMAGAREPMFAQHRHRDWPTNVRQVVARPSTPGWVSLPERFARLVLFATKDRQSERWDMSQVEAEVERLHSAVLRPDAVGASDMLAEEILARANGRIPYEWDEDLAEARCSLPGGAVVHLTASETLQEVTATIDWAGSGSEDRKSVGRYLGPRCDQAAAAMKRAGWVATSQSAANQTAHLVASRSTIGLARDLDRAAQGLTKALELMTFT
jgi:hypothetical protein